MLAYGNLALTKSVIACLVFPCTAEVWKELHQNDRLIHKANLLDFSMVQITVRFL